MEKRFGQITLLLRVGHVHTVSLVVTYTNIISVQSFIKIGQRTKCISVEEKKGKKIIIIIKTLFVFENK